jgi:hypothetical protein
MAEAEEPLSSQRQRQTSRVQQQEEHFGFWREEEAKLLSRDLADENFANRGYTFEKWLQADFCVDPTPSVCENYTASQWRPASFVASSFGIQLCGVALKLARPVHLKALALEVHVTLRLKGESAFWLTTRGKGIEDPDAVVCRLLKEEDSQRMFLELGALIGPEQAFRFFKRQEIPTRKNASEEALACDFTNVQLHFVDNGDSRVFLQLREGSRPLRSSCSAFVPCLEPTQLVLLGSGESVEVSQVKVNYAERQRGQGSSLVRKECCSLQ